MNYKSNAHFIVLGCLLLAFVSCRKPKFSGDSCHENCFTLEGFISDTFSNEPLADVEVNMRHWQGQWNYWVASAKTDANGYWKMSVDADYFSNSEEYVTLLVEKAGYLKTKTNLILDSAMIDLPLQQNHKLFRSACVNVNIEVKPEKNVGAFVLTYSSAGKEDYFLLNGPAPIDTMLRLEVAANVLTTIRGYTFGGTDLYDHLTNITVIDGAIPDVSFSF